MFKNDEGFTLIEMLIVLLIISVLLIITIPNLSDNNQMVRDKGCEALVKLAEAQVQAYHINKGTPPTSMEDLLSNDYLEDDKCPNGDVLVLTDGEIARTPTAPIN